MADGDRRFQELKLLPVNLQNAYELTTPTVTVSISTVPTRKGNKFVEGLFSSSLTDRRDGLSYLNAVHWTRDQVHEIRRALKTSDIPDPIKRQFERNVLDKIKFAPHETEKQRPIMRL